MVKIYTDKNVADLLTKAFDLYLILLEKAKKSIKLMMEMLFGKKLELMLFWATVKVKTVNGEVQLQALVDGKKIIITESIVRRDLQLEDAEGIDCLPNATIFEQLTLMGVLDLEEHKDCQAQEIISFKSRVKKVEKKGGSKLKAHKIIQAVIDDEGVFDRHDMLKKRLMWLEKEVSIAGVYMEEPVKTTKKKIKLVMSEEVASKTSASMQAELEEEDRIKNQEKLSIYQEKSKLLVKLLKQKDSTLQPIRVKEKRNKPPTKSSKKITMSTYLINMRAVQKACIAGTKKVLGGKKVDVDKERTEIQRLIEVVPINRKADESSKMYLVFSHMLKSFDNEDLETLWKLVKAKHGSTRPEESYDRVLWGDLKTMFDPHVKDQVWRNQQDYQCTDISKITRKPSKTGKHEHEKRKSTREAKDSKQSQKKSQASVKNGQKSKYSQTLSTEVTYKRSKSKFLI
ncbi:hypothetical protein Tco_0157125 [Tanacetum coccineum]